jgi:hypothetical protein
MQAESGKDVGVTDLSMGGSQNTSKKATVVFAEQQNVNKRLLLRSSPYTEAMGEIGKLFIQGCKDHLPAEKALKRLGIEGEGWEPVIRRADLDLYSDVDVRVVSSSIEMRNSQLKKEARMKVLAEIAVDPLQAAQVNPRWVVEEKLRSGGEYDDAEIAVAMDVKNYGNKEEQAHAHAAIQAVLHDEQPEMFYGATTLYMQILVDFASNNRNTLGPKFDTLMELAQAHAELAQENMLRKAGQEAAQINKTAPMEPGADVSADTAVPSATSQVHSLAANMS